MMCARKTVRLAINLSSCVLIACLLTATGVCDAAPATVALGEPMSPMMSKPPAAHSLIIYFSDTRTSSNVTVTLSGYDSGSTYYSDWETASGPIPGTSTSTKECSYMNWRADSSNLLREDYYGSSVQGDPYSSVGIHVWQFAPSTPYYNVTATVRAYINGYCHEDWQAVSTWSGDMTLYFNGNGATWDGSCYRGDMLRTTP